MRDRFSHVAFLPLTFFGILEQIDGARGKLFSGEIALNEFIRIIEPLSPNETVKDELSNEIMEEAGV